MKLRTSVAQPQHRPVRIYHRMAPRAQKRLFPFWVRLTIAVMVCGAAWALLIHVAGHYWSLLPVWGPVWGPYR